MIDLARTICLIWHPEYNEKDGSFYIMFIEFKGGVLNVAYYGCFLSHILQEGADV